LPVAAMFGNGSWQNVYPLKRTFHGSFLPSFSSFGWGFSVEKIKMWKVNGWQTTDDIWRTTLDGRRTPSDGKSSHCLWQGELKRGHKNSYFCNKILYLELELGH
jgi:hypothetical protein